ncbi:transcription repressor NadR [Dendrosporobacter sp. 1207_IL3150]|uniref:transcription repressor NadR n=1 Tax=Dendrosporobacter sp. 1207_IL3150 TaxID=3084054 RepID=UPI002FD8CD47
METQERRSKILARLKSTSSPLTGTALAKELGVSRQVIVGDIAIIRASGITVYATPQGYMIPQVHTASVIATIACRHDRDELEKELSIIIDNGGKVRDVIVEHPIYGEITANLMLSSRRELADFLHKLAESGAAPLATVTGGVHLHTIEVPSAEVLSTIEEELRTKGLLMR